MEQREVLTVHALSVLSCYAKLSLVEITGNPKEKRNAEV